MHSGDKKRRRRDERKRRQQRTFLLAPPSDTLGVRLKSPSKLNMATLFPSSCGVPNDLCMKEQIEILLEFRERKGNIITDSNPLYTSESTSK